MGKFMVKDVFYNKVEIIERCLIRVEEVYNQDPENLKDYTKQDSINCKFGQKKSSYGS